MKILLTLIIFFTLSIKGYSVTIDADSCTIDIPLAISVNEEENNNLFSAKAGCQLQSFEISIYNRWGREVYTSNNITENWDCSEIDADHYMWVVKAITIEGEAIQKTGMVKVFKETNVPVE